MPQNEDLHIPQKDGPPSPERSVRTVVRSEIAKEGGLDDDALVGILTKLFKEETTRDRQRWLEVERWATRRPTMALNGMALYDAIIDGNLTASIPSQHYYKNLGEAVFYEGKGPVGGLDGSDNPPFCVGVVCHTNSVAGSGFGIPTESANVSMQCGLTMEAIGRQNANAFTTPFRAQWDLNGFNVTCQTGGCGANGQAVFLHGIELQNTGSAIGTAFPGAASVTLEDSRVNFTDRANPATIKLTRLTTGILVARNSILESPIFDGSLTVLVSVGIPLYRTLAYNITSTSTNFFWFGGWIAPATTGAGINITWQGTSKQCVIRDVEYSSIMESVSSVTPTFIFSNTGVNYIEIHSENNAPNLSISAACGHTEVKGHFNTVTWNAPSTAGRKRIFRGSTDQTFNWTGPGLLEHWPRTQGTVIAGFGTLALIHGVSTGNPALSLSSCSDSLVLLDARRADSAAGAQAYTIDSGSARNLVIVAGEQNAGTGPWTVASVNNSTTTAVLRSAMFAGRFRDTGFDGVEKDIIQEVLFEGFGMATGITTYPPPVATGGSATIDDIRKDIIPANLFPVGVSSI